MKSAELIQEIPKSNSTAQNAAQSVILMKQAMDFAERDGSNPFNPKKHLIAVKLAFQIQWTEKLKLTLQNNPKMEFKKMSIDFLNDMPPEIKGPDLLKMLDWFALNFKNTLIGINEIR
jgi:hypothetical protein